MAIGKSTQAIASNSFVSGLRTKTKCPNGTAFGQDNMGNSDAIFEVGIGTSTDKKNAVEVKQNGDVFIDGIGGYDGTNPTNSEDLATVVNNKAEKTDIVQSDYNQNNNTAKDYIKNRPFYEDVILEDYHLGDTIELKLKYLSTIKIIVKDINVGILPTMILDSSNNYTARVNGTDQYYYANLNTETLILTIQEDSLPQLNIISVSQIKELDEEYIPSTIARKTDVNNKVDKITGKGLSTNDYTNDDKNKLSSIEEGAQKNIVPDWNAQVDEAGYIENKPAFVQKLQTYSIDYSNEERGLLPTEINTDGVIHFIAKSQSPAYLDLYFSVKINQDYTTITGMGIYPFKIKIQYGRIYAMLTRENDPTQEIIALKVVDFNESSLNNNVITTFKQELTEENKNQALANLGLSDVDNTLTTLNERIDEIEKTQEKVFIIPDDFIEEQYDEPDEDGANGKVKQIYVTDILENRYNKGSLGGLLHDINITEDFITITNKIEDYQQGTKEEINNSIDIYIPTCKFTQKVYQNKFPFVMELMSPDPSEAGTIRYEFVRSVTDEETIIPEENKQLFKKNMGSFADWNAGEGEPGYIENKPFGTNEKHLTIDDISSIDDEKGIYTVPIDYNAITFYTYDNGVWHDITLSLDDDLYAEYIDVYEIGTFIIQFTKENRQLELTFTDPEDDYEQAIIDHKIRLNKIKLLDANYISDTVIKTTPQILTEDEKTQVLSNLGISFIKYLISPHIVRRDDSQIPQDLNQILWSMKNYPLSFANNLMVCYVIREDETISYDPITLRYYEYDEDMGTEAFRFSFYDDPVYILADGRLEWM